MSLRGDGVVVVGALDSRMWVVREGVVGMKREVMDGGRGREDDGDDDDGMVLGDDGDDGDVLRWDV